MTNYQAYEMGLRYKNFDSFNSTYTLFYNPESSGAETLQPEFFQNLCPETLGKFQDTNYTNAGQIST